MSASLLMILLAIVAMAASGLPGLFMDRRSSVSEWIAVALSLGGAVLGLSGAAIAMFAQPAPSALLPLKIMGQQPSIMVDALSAFFLVPVFIMGGLGSVYGLGYWPQKRRQRSGTKLRTFWGLMVSGLALLVISSNGLVFLLGWEVMALSAFFLVSAEDHHANCRDAGWIYLIATHIGTLTLFAMFSLWRWATGSYEMIPAASGSISIGVKHALFLMALLGFGMKAGVMPLHFWLPPAHANAPSHVSAMLSGVVLKIGVYGLVRMLYLLPDPPAIWGAFILLLAIISALFGVVFAIAQHDLKRLLAYHSVENIGIIMMGLGLAMLGRSAGRPEWVVLGMAGCLLHVWNHSFFKSLLFLCAGSVIHSVHTREIDRLGGLAKRMPATALLFLVGAVAICGLPPLNGFVSELFVYLGLLRGLVDNGALASSVSIAAPVLAMVGALAVACFVKVFAAVFLGEARTSAGADAHEAPRSMLWPAGILASLCILIGVAPVAISPILDRAIAAWTGPNVVPAALSQLVPLEAVSILATALALAVLAIWLMSSRIARIAPRTGTWDCGYARPTSRMQYTASSLAQMVVGMFTWILRPHTRSPRVAGAFAQRTQMHSHVDDVMLDRVLIPAGQRFENWFQWFHRFQRGLTQHYVLYVLIAVVVMLAALIPFGAILARLSAF